MEFLSRKETPVSPHKNWIFFTSRLESLLKETGRRPPISARNLIFYPGRKDSNLYSN
jgi:hypothetical protein